MADATGAVTVAVLAILNADATVQARCGRATECAIAWGAFDLDRDPLPMLVFQDTEEVGGAIEGTRRVSGVLAAFATGETADDVAAGLLDAAEAALTLPALAARGLDACPDPAALPFPRDRIPIEDLGLPTLVQRTMALAIIITPE